MIDPIIPLPTPLPTGEQSISGDGEFNVFSEILEAVGPFVAEDLLAAVEGEDTTPPTPPESLAIDSDAPETVEVSEEIDREGAEVSPPLELASPPQSPDTGDVASNLAGTIASPIPDLEPPAEAQPTTGSSDIHAMSDVEDMEQAPPMGPAPDETAQTKPTPVHEPPPHGPPSHARNPIDRVESRFELPLRVAQEAPGLVRPNAMAASVRPTKDSPSPSAASLGSDEPVARSVSGDRMPPVSDTATPTPSLREGIAVAPATPQPPPHGPFVAALSSSPGLVRSGEVAARPSRLPSIESTDHPNRAHSDHMIDHARHDEAHVERGTHIERGARPMVTRMVERIESWIRRSENMPPPRAMTIGGPHLDGLRLRVSIDGGILSIQVHGASEGDLAWVRQVSDQLIEKGFDLSDISEFDEHGHRRPLWEDDPTRHRRRQRFILNTDEQGDSHD